MPTETSPLVSIVTPFYNEAKFLRECIESVLSQTYTNWDYTLVNNCSTDGSLAIAEAYAARDPRIRVHTNSSFVGAIANHNIAARLISPACVYTKFVAGDDWIYPDCVAQMVAVAERHPKVGIVGCYRLLDQHVYAGGLPFPHESMNGIEVGRQAMRFEIPYPFGAPTTLLFRSSLLREREKVFNEANPHCDMEACYDLLRSCDFGFVHQVLVYERVRPGSLMTHAFRYNTMRMSDLEMVLKFGLDYMTAAERQALIRSFVRAYYNFLGMMMFDKREKDFWAMHTSKLVELGFGVNRPRIWANAIAYALERLAARLRRRL